MTLTLIFPKITGYKKLSCGILRDSQVSLKRRVQIIQHKIDYFVESGIFLIVYRQAPDSEPSLTPVFLSSTCFRPPGAAQQQSGFLNFTSESV